MVEYEKKIPISEAEYNRITENLEFIHTDNQENYYYDTEDFFFNKQGTTFRIRKKDGKYTATIKKHNIKTKECNTEISKNVLDEYDTKFFVDKHIKLQGKLSTERKYFVKDDGFEIVIDKNHYLGTTDYEIEIEYSQQNKIRAEKTVSYIAELLCVLNNMEFSFSEFYNRFKMSKSKSQRFFEQKSIINEKRCENDFWSNF